MLHFKKTKITFYKQIVMRKKKNPTVYSLKKKNYKFSIYALN